MELATFALVGAAVVVALLAAHFSVRQGYERLAMVASVICLVALGVGTYVAAATEIQDGRLFQAGLALAFGAVFSLVTATLILSSIRRAIETRWIADSRSIALRITNNGAAFARFIVHLEIVASPLDRPSEGRRLEAGDRFIYDAISLQPNQSSGVPIANISSSWAGKGDNQRLYTVLFKFALLVNRQEVAINGAGQEPEIPSELLHCRLAVLREPPTLRRHEEQVRCWIAEDGSLLLKVNDDETQVLDKLRARTS